MTRRIQTQAYIFNVPAKREGKHVYNEDWNRLKKDFTNYSKQSNRLNILASWLCSSCVTAVFTFITMDNTNSYRQPLIYWAILTGAAGVTLLLVSKYAVDKSESSTKTQIIEDIMDIEKYNTSQEAEPTVENQEPAKTVLEDWIATKRDLDQGVDFKELALHGGILSSLHFTVSSDYPYWRAGFKLSIPNGEGMPPLFTDASFLFHIGVTNDSKVSLWIYHDGVTPAAVTKTLENIDCTSEISITLEINKNNFVIIYVNDNVEYNKRFNPELFKKVYLVAWADSSDFDTTFKRVEYSFRQ